MSEEVCITLALFEGVITSFYIIFLYSNKYISNHKKMYWKKYNNIASKYNCKVIVDKSNIFKWPLIVGVYKKRRIKIKTVISSQKLMKTGIYLTLHKNVPNLIWLFLKTNNND